MKTRTVLFSLLLCLTTGYAAAANKPHNANAQQRKMASCNQEAKAQSLQGEARKTFMQSCLKSKHAHKGKKLTAQQRKMKTCNLKAKQAAVQGEARQSFMQDCLKAQ